MYETFTFQNIVHRLNEATAIHKKKLTEKHVSLTPLSVKSKQEHRFDFWNISRFTSIATCQLILTRHSVPENVGAHLKT